MVDNLAGEVVEALLAEVPLAGGLVVTTEAQPHGLKALSHIMEVNHHHRGGEGPYTWLVGTSR